ncbi:MAG: GDYXXLXY domain-containing protein [Comamonadaceae bacterium]|nr:GDYXXLXY domain-containing protein [Comamonadaceae bacterium]
MSDMPHVPDRSDALPGAAHAATPATQAASHARALRTALALSIALVLGLAAWSVLGFETLLRQGRTVYLELAPVDPRSLMQGDYMALRYRLESEIAPPQVLQSTQHALPTPPRYAYLSLDGQQRATAVHSLGMQPTPPAGTIALRLRPGEMSHIPRLGPNAFFFQEGTAQQYEHARWGEMRVDAQGRALLVGLRDEQLQLLGENRL